MRKIGTAAVGVFLAWAWAAQGVQGQVLYTRGSAFGVDGELRLKLLGGSTTTIDSSVGSAQFSPDGNRIAYARKNGSSYEIVVASRDGSNKQVLAGGYAACPGLSWRQSGKVHYSHNREKKGYAIDVTTGSISIFYSSPQQLWSLSVDTACAHMTFYSRSITRGIWITDVTQGSGSETFVDGGCGNRISPDGTKFTNNLHTHRDMYIRNWNRSVYKSLSTGSSSKYWNSQQWSNNSNQWIIYPIGPSFQLPEWSNVWLHNFETGEKVQVTSGSYHDFPRDFWAGTVSNDPAISLNPSSLSFSATAGGSNPSGKTVSVTNSGGGTLGNVSASESASWLSVSRSGSGNSQTLTNSVNISGLSPNTYSTTVTVSGGGATNSASYTVTLAVSGPPVLTTINVTPSSVTVSPGASQAFSAERLDQNGDPISAAVSWNVSGGGSLSTTTGPTTTFTSDGSEGTFTLTASSGPVSGTATMTVSNLHLKVNCGSNTVSGWDAAHPYVSGGADYTFSTTIDTSGVADAAPPEVYKSCRHNAPSFSFPSLGDGDYTVRLHFADAYGAGRRSMDVIIEGQVVVNDLDISGEAGQSKALVKTVSVAVSDGNGMQIALDEDGGVDAFIGGIEIVGGAAPPPPPPRPPTRRPWPTRGPTGR